MRPNKPRPQRKRTGSGVTEFVISDSELGRIRNLLHAKTGITLGDQKHSLVVSRLSRRLRVLGLGGFKDYIAYLENDDTGGEMIQMINRLTTNKTDFFRENHHFEFLADKLLPRLYDQKQSGGRKVVRAWSAGCSSGEEPYCIAMVMSEFFKNRPGWDIKILATDLDTNILTQASAGVYEEHLLEPVSPGLRKKYFTTRDMPRGVAYKVRPELRALITFRKFNLMLGSYPIKVPLDFIFCRNVLIYFETQGKIDVLTKFHRVLDRKGNIFVGHSESLVKVEHLYNHVGTTVYQKA